MQVLILQLRTVVINLVFDIVRSGRTGNRCSNTLLHFNENVIKLIASVGTVIINYFFSKFVIFRKSKKNKDEGEKDE